MMFFLQNKIKEMKMGNLFYNERSNYDTFQLKIITAAALKSK